MAALAMKATTAWATAVLALLATLPAEAAPRACKLIQTAVFHVADEAQPVMDATVSGQAVRVLADTGARYSMISSQLAAKLKLHVRSVDGGMRLYGVGGEIAARYVENVRLEPRAGAGAFTYTEIPVGDGLGDGVDILMGEDALLEADVEFDMADKTIRLLRDEGCGDVDMPYWVKGAYSKARLVDFDRDDPEPKLQVRLNDHPFVAELDPGATVSVATPRAARAAKVTGAVVDQVGGIGERQMDRRVGQLQSFAVGDETIRDTKLSFAELWSNVAFVDTGSRLRVHPDDLPDMLLGADFLKSHRVLISPGHGKVFFSYVGGRVFDIDKAPPPPAAAAGR